MLDKYSICGNNSGKRAGQKFLLFLRNPDRF